MRIGGSYIIVDGERILKDEYDKAKAKDAKKPKPDTLNDKEQLSDGSTTLQK